MCGRECEREGGMAVRGRVGGRKCRDGEVVGKVDG